MAKRNRNIVYGSKNSPEQLSDSIDPDDGNLRYQDRSMQAFAMERRSVSELPTALEEQVGILAGRKELWQSREEVMEDMLAHTEPEILLIAGMGAALALLPAQGHYTYFSGQQ
jgi:hypothetical protein